uniref:Uncharacterized protein n=1 Tax=viral metagenome TaxID=1070528 RepID=A0A6C0F4F2_9ZZZZ
MRLKIAHYNIYNNIKQMSANLVNEITLEYLMSKEQHAKFMNKKKEGISSCERKDKKFYRKRILNLSRDLLLNQDPENLLHDVKVSFDNYVKICINYFKILDETDIIQEDYHEIKILNDALGKEDISTTAADADKLLMRTIKTNKGPLDNFVKIKTTKPPNPPIIPLQKDINLKDPELKNKGICKKNNITNKYEESTKISKENSKKDKKTKKKSQASNKEKQENEKNNDPSIA